MLIIILIELLKFYKLPSNLISMKLLLFTKEQFFSFSKLIDWDKRRFSDPGYKEDELNCKSMDYARVS